MRNTYLMLLGLYFLVGCDFNFKKNHEFSSHSKNSIESKQKNMFLNSYDYFPNKLTLSKDSSYKISEIFTERDYRENYAGNIYVGQSSQMVIVFGDSLKKNNKFDIDLQLNSSETGEFYLKSYLELVSSYADEYQDTIVINIYKRNNEKYDSLILVKRR